MNGQRLDQLSAFVPRSDLVELIPRAARRILDVGCGVGKKRELLREKGFEEIFEIEINTSAADEAKLFYRELSAGDIEKCTSAWFPQ